MYTWYTSDSSLGTRVQQRRFLIAQSELVRLLDDYYILGEALYLYARVAPPLPCGEVLIGGESRWVPTRYANRLEKARQPGEPVGRGQRLVIQGRPLSIQMYTV